MLPEGLDELENWLEVERQSLREMWSKQATNQAKIWQQQGKISEAINLLEKILQISPLAEDVLQEYLYISSLANQHERALSAFANFSKKLRDEFGLEPLEKTKQLIQSIRSQKIPDWQPGIAQKPIIKSGFLSQELIDREAELKLLGENSKKVILIAGEPGIGKTSLLQKAFPNAVWLHCIEGLEGVPYVAITNYLRTRKEYLQTLENYKDDLARLIPEIFPGFKPMQTDPITAKTRLLQALTFALTAEEKNVVFDDLQWADASTLELFIYLTKESRVKLFFTYRSNEINSDLSRFLRSLDKNSSIAINLNPLNQRQTTEFANKLLNHLPDGFDSWLYHKCGGNPFFIKEIIASLCESNALNKREKWIDTKIDIEFKIPNAISDLTKRRVAHLSESSQRILNVGSLMSANFSAFALSKVTGLSQWAVAEALIEAENAGFIKDNNFTHDLMRQNIRDNVPTQLKKLIHTNIAEKLVGQLSDEEIAEHWFAADHVDKACDLWLEIAGKLRTNNLIDQTLQILVRVEQLAIDQDRLFTSIVMQSLILINFSQWEMANRCLSKIDNSDKVDNLYIKFAYLKAKTNLLSRLNRQKEAWLYLKEAKMVLSKLNETQINPSLGSSFLDKYIQTGILWEECFLLLYNGEANKVIELLTREIENIRSKLRDLPDDPSLIKACVNLQINLSSAYAYLGDFATAIILTQDNIDKIRYLKSEYTLHRALTSLAFYFFKAGKLDEAEKTAKEILSMQQNSSEIFNPSLINRILAAINSEKGLFDIALDYAKHALETAGSIDTEICAKYELLVALYSLGKIQEAREIIETLTKIIIDIEEIELKADFCALIYRYGNDKQVSFAEKMLVSLDKTKISTLSWQDLQTTRNECLSTQHNQ